MGRKWADNGPSLTPAPYKKPKPLTDEQLASAQARKEAALEDTKRIAAKSRAFHKKLHNGEFIKEILEKTKKAREES